MSVSFRLDDDSVLLQAEWDLSFKLFVPTTYTRERLSSNVLLDMSESIPIAATGDLRGEIEGCACSVCSESTGTTEISEVRR